MCIEMLICALNFLIYFLFVVVHLVFLLYFFFLFYILFDFLLHPTLLLPPLPFFLFYLLQLLFFTQFEETKTELCQYP